jgi:DNA-binding IclR family transcriptional regulator
MPSASDAAGAPAAGQALAILRLLSTHAEPMPAARIAEDVGLPRSTAYKLLGVLGAHGFVTHLPEERRYGLGVAAFEIGSAYSRQAGLARLSRPLLARLVDETTHNAHLAVLHGADVLYLLEERAPRRPALVTDVGVRLPAHLTASGLAMLAALPPAQVRAVYPSRAAFVQRASPGPGGLSQLRSVLAETRRRGYAVERGTVSHGLASVAVGVLDHGGHPVAAIAVTFPAEAVDGRTEADLAAAAGRTAAELGRRIRGRRAGGA